ncbi:A24 family peptidase [Comamonas fluminis]|uniref:A24 family peptidase n=1 Tax=Comamonas fluminis TaxID=2796366 RepID=UPI001C44632C|nr:A24 family peptidase [Comamonas fluminis]
MLLFLIFLCVAGAIDVTYRKFFNWLAILGGLIAILSISVYPNSHPLNIKIVDSFFGAAIAFFVLLIFYKMKMMGAGDVKFAVVLGLWVGWKLLLPIWALSCLFAIAHGLFSRSALKYFFVTTSSMKDGTEAGNTKFIPYVTYLSVATVIVLGFYKNQ